MSLPLAARSSTLQLEHNQARGPLCPVENSVLPGVILLGTVEIPGRQ
jgi:hypothetical protein